MAKATQIRVNLQAQGDGSTAVIELFEFIDPFWGFDAVELNEKLKEMSGVSTIKLRIHSRGGNAVEGFAIYNILMNHPAVVEVEIVGLAASAASVVAMAADPGKIVMLDLAHLMIHDPWSYADGNSNVLRRAAELLDRIQPQIVKSYLRHSNLSALEISAAMSAGDGAGTWYSAEQAVEVGLAHEIRTDGTVPQNRVNLAGLEGVPQEVLAQFQEPAEQQGDEDLVAELLDAIRDAPHPTDQSREPEDRLVEILENALSEESDDA